MNPCPPQIAEIVAAIVQEGFLRIRVEGWAGRAERCAIEADHLHNLPMILSDYRPELLDFYWNVERSGFIAQSEGQELGEFERLWKRLERYVPSCSRSPQNTTSR
jgi:hypothetical protein